MKLVLTRRAAPGVHVRLGPRREPCIAAHRRRPDTRRATAGDTEKHEKSARENAHVGSYPGLLR
jgi:hypothetical protein